MKKIIIILTLLTLLLLSGCGIFNLDGWILPDDNEFLTLVQELDTPYKIGQYMLSNFESEEHCTTLTPYQLYKTRKGDCDDFSTFAVFIANYHGYETYQIKMSFAFYYHLIAIFAENGYYTFSENQYYNPFNQYYNSFDEIMQEFNGWTSYIVYDYNMNVIETN